MPLGLKKRPAGFYKNAAGSEPVREWLLSLPPEDRRIGRRDIATAEFGWPLGMPLCRALGGGLWEIRCGLSSNRIGRVIFCIAHENMVLLHGFIKKTQKTPPSEIELARRRKKEAET